MLLRHKEIDLIALWDLEVQFKEKRNWEDQIDISLGLVNLKRFKSKQLFGIKKCHYGFLHLNSGSLSFYCTTCYF